MKNSVPTTAAAAEFHRTLTALAILSSSLEPSSLSR
jgi:hypothetical protein